MYVSVPKNYSGNAFPDRQTPKTQAVPAPTLPGAAEKKPPRPAPRRTLGLDAEELLLIGLIVCAIAANITRRLLPTVIIYATFSVMLSVIWLLLKAPDLAITEAAVGAGIDTILFLLALKAMHHFRGTEDEK